MSTDRQPRLLDFRRAIICALAHEFDAVEALFDEHYYNVPTEKHHKDSNFYRTGRIGADYVVLTRLAKMGKGEAATASAMIRLSFPGIDLTLVVGICGGLPFPTEHTELILGDVIVSHQVVEFDFGRQYPNRFEQKGNVLDILDRSNREIRSFLSGLQTRSEQDRFQEIHNGYLQFLEQKDTIWRYPGVHRDCLFSPSCEHVQMGEPRSNDDCDNVGCQGELVKRRRLARRGAPRPLVHLGPIASGDTVMKSAKHRDALARNSRIIGVEMEGAGVCNSLSCLIIKGACDYADSHKNDVWQHYAAASAAACAKALLKRLAELRLEYGAYIYSQSLQTNTDNSSATIISRSVTDTHDAVQHVKSVEEVLRRFGDGIPNAIMRHALVPVASNMAGLNGSGVQNLRKTKLFKSNTRRTMFGTICLQTQVIEHQIIAGDEYSSRTETKTAIIFHPALWLLRLGFKYGLMAMATNHNRTWRYTIQPVHAVPDNSLIFRFCETGNVDAVRELFTRGDASVFDTDTIGWGPLHHAANSGQFEIAKFLILEGADKRANAYYFREPASLISASTSPEKMLDLLFLFEDCISFWDQSDTGWSVLSGLQTSRGRINPSMARDCYSFLLQKYRAEGTKAKKLDAVCWALAESYRNKQYGCMQTLLEFDSTFQGFSPSCYEEAEGEGMATFMAWFDLVIDFHGETPTSRSLRFSCMFFGWQGETRFACADDDRLFARETSQGNILTIQGWRYDTLGNLFLLKPRTHLTDTYGNDRFYLQDPLHYPSCVLPECSISEPAYDIDYHGIVVEPWWEELKHLVRAGKCVCFIQQWVSDDRDARQIRHDRCQKAVTDSVTDSSIQMNMVKMFHESLDSTNSSFPVATLGSYTHFSNCVTTKFAALRIEHYYMKYRGFRHEYEPGEYYCFYCLATREGWELDSGWEPICELHELAEGLPSLWEGSDRYEDSFYSGEEFIPEDDT